MRCAILLLAASGLVRLPSACAADAKQSVFVGTYTGGASRGIFHLQFDPNTGAISKPELAAESANPSFLAIHPSGKFLYSVNEVGDFGGEKAGAVSAFALDATSGVLQLLNQQSSRGSGPCHLTVDRTGRNLLVANYGGGSVAVLPIGADGRLAAATAFIQHQGSSADSGRQAGPHAHSINLDAANRFAVVADLGLDRVLVYRFDPRRGTLAPNDPAFTALPPASGPRHFAFHPDARHAYVINEMKSTVTVFEYDAGHGSLRSIQTITTLPEGAPPSNSTAEVQVHPSGKFLYGSNRGHNSLAIFAIDPATGRLTSRGHQPTGGKTPRNFGIDPTGRFILAANQDSDTIAVLRVDPRTGGLQPTGQTATVPAPVCVKFVALP
jgi:6-phosphogluconolactonase